MGKHSRHPAPLPTATASPRKKKGKKKKAKQKQQTEDEINNAASRPGSRSRYQPPIRSHYIREFLIISSIFTTKMWEEQRDLFDAWKDVTTDTTMFDLFDRRWILVDTYLLEQFLKHDGLPFRPTFYKSATSGTYLDIFIPLEWQNTLRGVYYRAPMHTISKHSVQQQRRQKRATIPRQTPNAYASIPAGPSATTARRDGNSSCYNNSNSKDGAFLQTTPLFFADSPPSTSTASAQAASSTSLSPPARYHHHHHHHQSSSSLFPLGFPRRPTSTARRHRECLDS